MKTIIIVHDDTIRRTIHNELNALSAYYKIHIIVPIIPGLGRQYHGEQHYTVHSIKQSSFKLFRPIGTKITNIFNALYYVFAAAHVVRNTRNDLAVIRTQKLPFIYKILLPSSMNMVMYYHAELTFTFKGRLYNHVSKFSSKWFNKLIIDTEQNIIDQALPRDKCYICGFGFVPRKFQERSFDAMNLIYVGVLRKRNIHETIYGFKKFYDEYGSKISMRYNIIGNVDGEDKQLIQDALKTAGINTPVKYHGWLSDDEVDTMFGESNIGVAFNRSDSCYANFISFKLHEYLLSGLVVTSTFSELRSEVISDVNGVIHESSAEGFYNALVYIYNHLDTYDSNKIRESDVTYSLEYNIQNIQVPMYKKLIETK